VKLIRQLWYILSPKERVEGSILLCGMALGALFEAVSIGLVVPFIAVLKDPGLVLNARLAQPVLSALDIRDPQLLLIALGLGLVAAFVAKSGYLVLLYYWLLRYVFQKQITLTERLLTGYMNAPYDFHLRRNSAEMIKATTTTILRFTTGFLVSLLSVLGEFLVIVALVALLILVSPAATVGAVLALGLPTALIYGLTKRRLAESGRVAERSMASMIQWGEQALNGIKETLIMDRAPFFIDRHGDHARQFAASQRSVMFFFTIPRLAIDTLAVGAIVVIALFFVVRGQDTRSLVPVLGMFAVAAMRLMPSASRIASGLTGLRFHYAATEVLYHELQEIQASGNARRSGAPAEAARPLLFDRSLVLEHVSYRYPSMPRPAIDDVSLEIPKGHWIGLIGPTGAGKTTLIDLILGLFAPTSGRILVDGCDLQDDIAGWQRNIGYIPQDIYLMDDTVRRNVGFGLPDQKIDDERVWKALRAAQIDTLVRSLPGELDAMIGERGDRLSGGERQRLGIARALYRDPQILVVDEGTAHLDNETEAAIAHTLAKLKGEKTIIVVSHRLALVRSCDRIYLIRQGQVRNSGAYSDLLSTDSAFREFTGSAA
jgi:ABC-type multidrug transport system fused ATPase/permease subunit